MALSMRDLMALTLLWTYFTSLTFYVECANILLSPQFGDGSHFYSMVPIGRSLLAKGHNVTFLVADVYEDRARKHADDKRFNFEHVISPGLAETMDNVHINVASASLNGSIMQQLEAGKLLLKTNAAVCEDVLSDEGLLERLAEYDAFVIDVIWTCGIYVESYLARHRRDRDIPIALVVPMAPLPYAFQESGTPFFPSYQPTPLSGYTSSMSFFQRLKNTISYLANIHVLFKVVFLSSFYDLVDKYDLDPHLKSTVSNHLDLFLMNVDFSVEFSFPLMPNVISVGGLTTRPAKPLDEDLEQFMQSSDNEGVIVFSLGTYFSTITSTRPDIVKMLLDAFSRLPQKCIMHLMERPAFEIPVNIKVMSWLPLNDLLGHPKTRIFFTHGGNNAFYESVYHGVPVVVMPVVGDQHDIAVRVVANSLGAVIHSDRLNSNYIYQQVYLVLNDPKYRVSAKRLSAVYRDRPMSPADTAAFWIDHVIKHGSDHLRPPTLDMSFFQIYLLDVVIFVMLVATVTIYISLRVTSWCCTRTRSTKMKQE